MGAVSMINGHIDDQVCMGVVHFPEKCSRCEHLKITQTSLFDAAYNCGKYGFYCDTDGRSESDD